MGIMPDEQMHECAECGAPASEIAYADMTGVDFDGEEAIFHMVRIQCAVGHWYDEMQTAVKL